MTAVASRAWRRGASLALACLLLGGCAALRDDAPPAAGATATPAARAPYRLEVDAPDALRALLLEHLDVARFRRAADAQAIDDIELRRLAAAAPAQARALLETEGYFGAEVEVEVERGAGEPPLLKLHVRPGVRSTIRSVALEASGPLAEAAATPGNDAARLLESLRAGWPLPPGRPFRQADWTAAKNATLAKLRAQGYPSASWAGTAAQVDAPQRRVDLALTLDSGPLYRLGEIQVEGLQRYDESTVRRLATFARGAPYSEKLLLDYQERLQKIGLFAGASVEVEPDPASAAAAPVRVRVRELSLQQATVGVGVSANTGARVTLEHRHRRPFGLDWVATNKFEIGAARKSWEGGLISHPLDGLYRNLVAGTAERLSTGDEVRTAWSARLGRLQDRPRLERLYFAELVHARVDNPAGRTSNEALSANVHWIYRDLDSVLLPTRGITLSLQTAAGQARSRSETQRDGPFVRAWSRLTGYLPLGAAWYANARIEAGQVLAQGEVGVPDTLLFRAGGDDSVRGYAYRSLGPEVDGTVTSGHMVLTGSVEIARPVSERLPSVWWAAFVDAGNAADRWSELRPALGYGLGLRWRSPVGPLRADLAYGQETRKRRLHLSVGIAF